MLFSKEQISRRHRQFAEPFCPRMAFQLIEDLPEDVLGKTTSH